LKIHFVSSIYRVILLKISMTSPRGAQYSGGEITQITTV
jgi:hypothetical protein